MRAAATAPTLQQLRLARGGVEHFFHAGNHRRGRRIAFLHRHSMVQMREDTAMLGLSKVDVGTQPLAQMVRRNIQVEFRLTVKPKLDELGH